MESEDTNWTKQTTQETNEYFLGIYSIIHNNKIQCYNSLHRKRIWIHGVAIWISQVDMIVANWISNSWSLNQYRSPTNQLLDFQQLNKISDS